MRRAFFPILSIALLLLLAGTWLAWQHRFEIDPAHPHLTLGDLAGDGRLNPGVRWEKNSAGAAELVLEAGTPGHATVQLLPLPLTGPVEFLMLGFAVQGHALKPGPMKWSDGRLMIEWHPAGRPMAPQYLVSARFDQAGAVPGLVSHSGHGPAVPVLRVEHLGSSGAFRIQHCRIDVVRESVWWTTGRWLLLGGWLAWATTFAAWGRASGLGRPLLAAALWLFCITQWAVPGPWQAIRPLAPGFDVAAPAGRARLPEIHAAAPAAPATSSAGPAAPSASPAAAPGRPAAAPAAPAAPAALGELPFGGSLLLEIKDRIQQARPLFHLLLFFGPTLVFALLVGRGKATGFALLLAASIEGSQYLFGYGFDATDVRDLSYDTLGVMLALLLHARISRWWQMRKTAAEPVAASAGEPA